MYAHRLCAVNFAINPEGVTNMDEYNVSLPDCKIIEEDEQAEDIKTDQTDMPAAENAAAAKEPKQLSRAGKLAIAILVAAVLMTGSVYLLLWSNCTSVSGSIGFPMFSLEEDEIDLRGCSNTDFSGLYRIKNLKKLDIRGCDISVEKYNELKENLGDCEIIWSVPMGERRINSNSSSITIDDSDDLTNLHLVVSLAEVDATACTDIDRLMEISAQLEGVRFAWNVTVDGKTVSSLDESCVLSSGATAQDIAQLKYLPGLKYVDAKECKLYDELVAYESTVSGCDVEWIVDLAGRKISSLEESVDLRGTQVSSVSSVSGAVKYLPNLTYLDMCGCGLGNADMQSLRDTFPKVKFVWYISFARWTNIRTDIQVFSTLNLKRSDYGSYDFAPLFKYCTDLVALDLGHNSIRDISGLANLKKLQGLVLIDNPIKNQADITVLGELPELVFAELNATHISNVAPLSNCKKLIHLDLYSTLVTDPSPLYGCNNLRYVILARNKISKADLQKLSDNLHPDCHVVGTLIGEENLKLRNNPVRSAFRLAFKNWQQVESFEDYQHVTYKEGAELIIPRGYEGEAVQ